MRLAQLATPGHVVGVLMPCHSDPQDERDATRLAAHFAVPTVRVDLAGAYDPLLGLLKDAVGSLPAGMHQPASADDPRTRLSLANVKPRLRMTSLYYIANSLNYLVAGTGNRSELSIGYFTKYGDGGVDVLPIANLVKSQVRAVARELGVPEDLVERTPSAGLWLGQTDEAEMGFTYVELERYLNEGPQAVDAAVAEKIARLARVSEHKRRLAPAPPQ